MLRKTVLIVAIVALGIVGVVGVVGGNGGTASGAVPEPSNEKVVGLLTVDGLPTVVGVRSFSWALSVEPPPISGGGGGGAAEFANFIVTTSLSRISPKLFSLAANKTPIDSVMVEVFRPGTGNEVQTVYTLTNVFITSVEDSHGGEKDAGPIETIGFDYRKLEERFKPTSGDDVVRCYDRQQQGPC